MSEILLAGTPLDRVAVLGAVAVVVFALVFSRSNGAEQRFRPSRAGGLMLLGLVLGAALVNLALDSTGLHPDIAPRQLVHYHKKRVDAWADWPAQLLVIDGGSFANRGVDGEALEKHLRSRGFDVRVVQLCIRGGNHFERASIQGAMFEQLADDPRARRTRLIHLREIHLGYDRQPGAQIKGLNGRTVDYLTPRTAWAVAEARWSQEDPRLGDLLLYGKLLYFSAFRYLNINRLQRLETPDRYGVHTGYSPLAEEGKTIDEVTPVLATAAYLRELTAHTPPTDYERLTGWREKLWERQAKRFAVGFQSYQQLGFLPPNLRQSHWLYFFNKRREETPRCIGADESLLSIHEEFDEVSYWYDLGHLTAKGAKRYTEVLAAQIASSGVLESRP